MSRVRLVATDLDGTLLDPSGRIADADAAALIGAAEAGVRIVVATGRPARWLGCLEPILDAHPHVIASNGAAVYDLASGAVVQRHALERAALVDLSSALRAAFPGVLLALEHGERFGCEPGWNHHLPDPLRTIADEDDITVRGELDHLLERVSPVVKLLALSPDLPPDDFAHAASALLGTRAEVTHSALPGQPCMLEISAPGVSKASTLATHCASLGIERSEVAAFGDMPNDLALLAFAGHPFAMGNAHPLLKERYPVVGSNAEGGVGTTVARLLARA